MNLPHTRTAAFAICLLTVGMAALAGPTGESDALPQDAAPATQPTDHLPLRRAAMAAVRDGTIPTGEASGPADSEHRHGLFE